MPVYYRKRISNGKGFRLNLHGSKKGLGASYSLHTKKKKGEAAITFNSKRGWTASIHGSGLRWQSSQKGKGVTGKTREQISRDAASKKWNREREVEERKRTREYARREKERNKEEARLERELAAQHRRMQKVRQAKEKANEKRHKAIDNHTSKIADRAKKRFLKIQTEFEKFDEQIYPKIDQHEINIDNYDGSEEQLIKLFSENFEIQSKYENEGQEILNYQMTMTETVVLDNQDAVATRLKRDFGVIWSSLSKGILDLQVNEDSVDRMRDNTEILDSLCDRLVSYYLDYILNEYLSYCFSKKELSDTVLKELNNICAIDFNDSKIFVNCLLNEKKFGNEITAFKNEKYFHTINQYDFKKNAFDKFYQVKNSDNDKKIKSIISSFLKNYLCGSTEIIENELKEETGYKDFFISYYDLVKNLAMRKISSHTKSDDISSHSINLEDEKLNLSDDEIKYLDYLLEILADSFSRIPMSDNQEVSTDEIKNLTRELDIIKELSSPNKNIELSALAISYLIHLIGHLEDEVKIFNPETYKSEPLEQAVISFEKIDKILGLVSDISKHINFDSKSYKDQIMQVRELLSNSRIALFDSYNKNIFEPLFENIDEDNILECNIKEFPNRFKEITTLLEYISPQTERFRDMNLAITDNGMKEFKLCEEYLSVKINYLLELYAACAEEVNDNIDDNDLATLTKKSLMTLDLKEDFLILTNNFSNLSEFKSLKLSYLEIETYIDDLQSNIIDKIKSRLPKTSNNTSNASIKEYSLEDSYDYLAHLQESYCNDFVYQPDLVWSKEILEYSQINNMAKKEFLNIFKNNSIVYNKGRHNPFSFRAMLPSNIIFVNSRSHKIPKISYIDSDKLKWQDLEGIEIERFCILRKKLSKLANDMYEFILPIYDSSLKNDNTTSSKKSSLSIYVAFLSLLKDVNYVELFKSEPVKYHNYKSMLVDTLGKLIFNPLFPDQHLHQVQKIHLSIPVIRHIPINKNRDKKDIDAIDELVISKSNVSDISTKDDQSQTKYEIYNKKYHTFKNLIILTLFWFVVVLVETSFTDQAFITLFYTIYLLYRVFAYVYYKIKYIK